ncbi:MAG: hypothetical protein ACETVN_04460 [Asgard group archaeon]
MTNLSTHSITLKTGNSAASFYYKDTTAGRKPNHNGKRGARQSLDR